ncbi:MAG: prepilin-type N-terminal cleavage/methylation domain-containing protein [Candidatus Sulfotelmatobacter sp.]
MKISISKSQRGFSLLEMLVASAIGLIAIMAMTQLFNMGMNATLTVTQRADTQENMRAGIELMTKDISMAGAGLPSGGLQLATADGASKVACNQAGTCYLTGDVYPLSGSGVANYMYGILPGAGNGVQSSAVIAAAPAAVNDSITSIYCDYNFPLVNFAFSFPSSTQVTVGPALPANIVAGDPTNILAPGGLNVGDLLLFTVNTPGTGKGNQGTSYVQQAAAVGEITGIPNNTTINFATSDALNLNQTGTNSLASVATAYAAAGCPPNITCITVCRLYAVTYFLQVPPAGGTLQTPRLMRQVNGLTAVPVADGIINLQFSYDVINNSLGTISANQANPIGAGLSPALIQKVNIWVMGESVTQAGKKSQSMYLASSVSTRNMSFCNSYSDQTTACQ